jgi:hypothetical protein
MMRCLLSGDFGSVYRVVFPRILHDKVEFTWGPSWTCTLARSSWDCCSWGCIRNRPVCNGFAIWAMPLPILAHGSSGMGLASIRVNGMFARQVSAPR